MERKKKNENKEKSSKRLKGISNSGEIKTKKSKKHTKLNIKNKST